MSSIEKKRYFGTDGIRGKVGQPPVTAEFMLKLGWAAGRVLARGGKGKVLIGKDTRVSGYMFESALEAGLSAAGIDIHLLGPMPTPAIAYLTRTFHAQAGIVISASHNPFDDNGIKFFCGEGKKLPDDMELAIEAELDNPMITVDSAQLGKAERMDDAPGRYIEFCKSTVPAKMSYKGLTVVVDCANGATYHVAPDVFDELGAKVIRLGVQPDGFNINAGCGSTHPEHLKAAVVEHGADLGIAFDGDGDRVIMVDGRGEVVDGDELLYIIARAHLRQNKLSGAVVGTVMSNLGLEQALTALDVDFHRTPVGDRHVLDRLMQQGWTLGGETSGHIICLEHTTTGDGIISALQVVTEMVMSGRPLHELKAGMAKLPQRLVNVRVEPGFDFQGHPGVQEALRAVEAELGDRGRVLLRASGTEPLVRVMIEGTDPAQVARLADRLATAISEAHQAFCADA